MNEKIVFKVDTNILKKAIKNKYGGVINFASKTKFSEKSIYNWLQSGSIKSNILFEIAEILEIEDLNVLKQKEVIKLKD